MNTTSLGETVATITLPMDQAETRQREGVWELYLSHNSSLIPILVYLQVVLRQASPKVVYCRGEAARWCHTETSNRGKALMFHVPTQPQLIACFCEQSMHRRVESIETMMSPKPQLFLLQACPFCGYSHRMELLKEDPLGLRCVLPTLSDIDSWRFRRLVLAFHPVSLTRF